MLSEPETTFARALLGRRGARVGPGRLSRTAGISRLALRGSAGRLRGCAAARPTSLRRHRRGSGTRGRADRCGRRSCFRLVGCAAASDLAFARHGRALTESRSCRFLPGDDPRTPRGKAAFPPVSATGRSGVHARAGRATAFGGISSRRTLASRRVDRSTRSPRRPTDDDAAHGSVSFAGPLVSPSPHGGRPNLSGRFFCLARAPPSGACALFFPQTPAAVGRRWGERR